MDHREVFLRECVVNFEYGGVPPTGADTFGWTRPSLAQTLTGVASTRLLKIEEKPANLTMIKLIYYRHKPQNPNLSKGKTLKKRSIAWKPRQALPSPL